MKPALGYWWGEYGQHLRLFLCPEASDSCISVSAETDADISSESDLMMSLHVPGQAFSVQILKDECGTQSQVQARSNYNFIVDETF